MYSLHVRLGDQCGRCRRQARVLRSHRRPAGHRQAVLLLAAGAGSGRRCRCRRRECRTGGGRSGGSGGGCEVVAGVGCRGVGGAWCWCRWCRYCCVVAAGGAGAVVAPGGQRGGDQRRMVVMVMVRIVDGRFLRGVRETSKWRSRDTELVKCRRKVSAPELQLQNGFLDVSFGHFLLIQITPKHVDTFYPVLMESHFCFDLQNKMKRIEKRHFIQKSVVLMCHAFHTDWVFGARFAEEN